MEIRKQSSTDDESTNLDPSLPEPGDRRAIRGSRQLPADDEDVNLESSLAGRSANSEPEPVIGWADALGADTENPPQARVHGRQLIEPDGTTHIVSTCENRIKAQFELWVQNNSLRAIAQAEATGDLERAEKMMSAYTGDWGAGHYSWDGRYVRRARFESLPGICHLVYLLMVRCSPDKT
mgnify:FL=1